MTDKQKIKMWRDDYNRMADKFHKVDAYASDIKSKLDAALEALKDVSIQCARSDAPTDWTHSQRVQWSAAKALERIAVMRLRDRY